MALRCCHALKYVPIYIRLLHFLLVILSCSPASTTASGCGGFGICVEDNSECKSELGSPVIASCDAGLKPGICCKVDCQSDDDCQTLDSACINSLCSDPCDFTAACGFQASCTVIKRQPICTCPPNYSGNPSEACFPERCVNKDGSDRGICLTGEVECVNKGGKVVATCASGFGVCCLIQTCEKNVDCSSELACISSTCQDPCRGTCGDLACEVEDHIPQCIDPRCKVDAECQSNLACSHGGSENFVCIRIPCEKNADCLSSLVCIDYFCSDPCEIPGTCGYQATCTVVNHQPICDCPPYFTGNPSEVCFPAKCGSTSGPLGDCLTREDCRKQGGILYGTCASGFGVCCLDSRYCDHSDYASSLVCINSRPYSNIQSERKAVSYRKKKAVKGRRRITKRK